MCVKTTQKMCIRPLYKLNSVFQAKPGTIAISLCDIPAHQTRVGKLSGPILSCSTWGLPHKTITSLCVRSYRTFSPLPNAFTLGGTLFCGTFRRLSPPELDLLSKKPCSARFQLGVQTFLTNFRWRDYPSNLMPFKGNRNLKF